MDKDQFIQQIVKLDLHTDGRQILFNALELAEKAHSLHKRLDGTSYISHAISVASTLADWRSPPSLIAAGLLHDVMNTTYSTPPSFEAIRDNCGKEVELLVRVSTEISRFGSSYPGEEKYQELDSVEKISVAFPEIANSFSQTPLVIILRIANHLDDAMSIEYVKKEKQELFARIALNILAPHSARLGMDLVKRRLEDIGFKILDPIAYSTVLNKYPAHLVTEHSEPILATIKEAFQTSGTKARVTLSPRSYYSLYRSWLEHGGSEKSYFPFEGVYPYLVTVGTLSECYQALGILHCLFTPVPAHLYDFIGAPKVNKYQAIHTKVRLKTGVEIDIIIRDEQMQAMAEEGIIIKWKTKSQDLQLEVDQLESPDPNQLYVFTPMGEIRTLPINSTPVDFAYAVHRDIGSQCIGAIVNGKKHDLEKPLQAFASVQIITSRSAIGPQTKWLSSVKTKVATAEIQRYYGVKNPDPSIDEGRQILVDALVECQANFLFPELKERINLCLENKSTIGQLLTDIAHSKIDVNEICQLILYGDAAKMASQNLREVSKIVTLIARDHNGLVAEIKKIALDLKIGLEVTEIHRLDNEISRINILAGDLPDDAIEFLIAELKTLNSVLDAFRSGQQPVSSLVSNPYPITPARGLNFKGREKELANLLDILKGRGQSILIWGPRRIGKTSLLGGISDRLDPERFLPVTVDFQNTKITTTLELLHFVIENIALNRPNVNIPKWSTIKKNPLYTFDNLIRRAIPDHSVLVLTFDEFPIFNNLEEKRGTAHLTRTDLSLYLRNQLQHHGKINLVFSGGGILRNLIRRESTSALLELSTFMELDFLAREDAKKVIVETAIKYDLDTIERIIEITSNFQKTANHPWFIQIVCQDLTRRYGNNISLEVFNEWQRDYLCKLPEQHFNNLWGWSLGIDEIGLIECLAALLTIALEMESNPWVAEEKVINSELGIAMSRLRTLRALKRLEAIRSIVSVSDTNSGKMYMIKVPIGAIWLKQNYSPKELLIDHPSVFGNLS